MTPKRRGSISLLLAALLVVAVPLYFLIVSPTSFQDLFRGTSANRAVSFDVNPSLQLTLDASDRVVATKAFNADAQRLLSTLNLRGLDASEAVGLVVGAAFALCFIDPASVDTYIGISIEDNRDGNDADELRLKNGLRTAVRQGLEHQGAQGDIDVFVVPHDLVVAAARLDISAGRLSLIDRLAAAYGMTRMDAFNRFWKTSAKEIVALLVATGTYDPSTDSAYDPAASNDPDVTGGATESVTPGPNAPDVTGGATANPTPDPNAPDVTGGATAKTTPDPNAPDVTGGATAKVTPDPNAPDVTGGATPTGGAVGGDDEDDEHEEHEDDERRAASTATPIPAPTALPTVTPIALPTAVPTDPAPTPAA